MLLIELIQLFQSTLPCRERRYLMLLIELIQLFQSTLPCRERLFDLRSYLIIVKFQSTLPCRERPITTKQNIYGELNFNPRSRVGSDYVTIAITSLDGN